METSAQRVRHHLRRETLLESAQHRQRTRTGQTSYTVTQRAGVPIVVVVVVVVVVVAAAAAVVTVVAAAVLPLLAFDAALTAEWRAPQMAFTVEPRAAGTTLTLFT